MDVEKGPLIAFFPDGTKIYKNGLVDSRGYIEATIGIYNFSSEFNPNTGKWERIAPELAIPIGEDISLQLNGDALGVTIGGSIPVVGPAAVDIAIIIDSDGNVSNLIGASLGKEIGGVGLRVGAGLVFADRPSRGFSRLDTISVSPKGDVYETNHYPASTSDDGKTHYFITTRTRHFDSDGNLLNVYRSGIGDFKTAADLAANLRGNTFPIPKVRRVGPIEQDFQESQNLLEERYEGDTRIINEFLRMSAPVPQSTLNPFAEHDLAELQDDEWLTPTTEISGTRDENRARQEHANQLRIDELVQPAIFRRSVPASDQTSVSELINPLAINDIVGALPGVGSALEHRSKMISAQLESRTNNEQLPVVSPIPRPRPKLNPITEGYLKDMPDDGRLILAAEMVGYNGRKEADKAEAERMAHFDVQRKMAQDLEDIKVGKVSTVWDRYGHPKAVRDLLGEEAYQNFVDDRLEAGIISNATAGLHLLQDAELFGIADGTTALEAPHEKLAELMTPKVLAAAAERARDILDMRRTKPSEAVLLSSDLSNRKAAFDAAFDANETVDAEEMDAFLFYHEAAQREIGIAEPAIEMIPPRWASQVAARFETPQAGNSTPTDRRAREAELKQHYTELQQNFGPRTDDVIAYSLARTASNGALPSGQGISQ